MSCTNFYILESSFSKVWVKILSLYSGLVRSAIRFLRPVSTGFSLLGIFFKIKNKDLSIYVSLHVSLHVSNIFVRVFRSDLLMLM